MQRQLLTLTLGQRWYALALAEIREILPLAALSQPPVSPPFLEGLLNLAGQLVPVVNLARLFGLEPPRLSLYTPLILLHTTPTMALLVERVGAILTLESQALRPVPAQLSLNGCVQGEFSQAGTDIHLLDAAAILLSQEQARLEALRVLEQQRLQQLEGSLP